MSSSNEQEEKTGVVYVYYVDTEGKEISTGRVIIGNVGQKYETVEKEIDGYSFIKVTGNVTGTIKETEQTVIYIYDKNIGYGEDEEEKILPPKTGYEPNSNMIMALLELLGLTFIFKRKSITEK